MASPRASSGEAASPRRRSIRICNTPCGNSRSSTIWRNASTGQRRTAARAADRSLRQDRGDSAGRGGTRPAAARDLPRTELRMGHPEAAARQRREGSVPRGNAPAGSVSAGVPLAITGEGLAPLPGPHPGNGRAEAGRGIRGAAAPESPRKLSRANGGRGPGRAEPSPVRPEHSEGPGDAKVPTPRLRARGWRPSPDPTPRGRSEAGRGALGVAAPGNPRKPSRANGRRGPGRAEPSPVGPERSGGLATQRCPRRAYGRGAGAPPRTPPRRWSGGNWARDTGRSCAGVPSQTFPSRWRAGFGEGGAHSRTPRAQRGACPACGALIESAP